MLAVQWLLLLHLLLLGLWAGASAFSSCEVDFDHAAFEYVALAVESGQDRASQILRVDEAVLVLDDRVFDLAVGAE